MQSGGYGLSGIGDLIRQFGKNFSRPGRSPLLACAFVASSSSRVRLTLQVDGKLSELPGLLALQFCSCACSLRSISDNQVLAELDQDHRACRGCASRGRR